MKVGRQRNLTDSEARWEAINLITGAAEGAVANGNISASAEIRGWTEADAIAIERHVFARIDGLIRRQRKHGEEPS